jgi:hypothetical protein
MALFSMLPALGGQWISMIDLRRSTHSRFFLDFRRPFSPDTKHIFVNVGFGFHAELTLDEALEFIKKKEVHLQK